jgi:hypothetical protein
VETEKISALMRLIEICLLTDSWNHDSGTLLRACLQDAHDALIRTEVAQDLLTGDFRLDAETIANGDNVAFLDDGEPPGEDFARLLMVFSGSGVHVQLQRDTGADLSPRGVHFTAIHRAGGLIHQGRENRIGVVSIEADE